MEDVPGHEDAYSLSREGKIWSKHSRCFLKPRSSGKTYNKTRPPGELRSYKTVALWDSKKKSYRYYYIHRLVAKTFVLNPENKPEVNHLNGNKADNRAKNLEWATRRENVDHALLNNLLTRGTKNGSAKLTEQQVREIRALWASGELSQSSIGEMYKVTQGNIYAIVNNKNWSWLR